MPVRYVFELSPSCDVPRILYILYGHEYAGDMGEHTGAHTGLSQSDIIYVYTDHADISAGFLTARYQ